MKHQRDHEHVKTPKSRKRDIEQMLPRKGVGGLSSWKKIDNAMTYRPAPIAKRWKQNAGVAKGANIGE